MLPVCPGLLGCLGCVLTKEEGQPIEVGGGGGRGGAQIRGERDEEGQARCVCGGGGGARGVCGGGGSKGTGKGQSVPS